ncbi:MULTISPECIES: 50S ribosomal protein L4 [Gardnerella]|jgi:50S ribosomal protein L4|uniref:Large ribosomal subunit protein uL4 n=4 Tax=Bacillati TaxID=1783272 RepID=A0AAP8IT50_GARVA|nr:MULTISPECIES: 50S ribosomal protein L4 [Gardnerella]EFH27912.1 ribosomal protein L4 [Gardnerella vaginalis AMD]EIK79121.1 50S ribosomal protein L4 [Gardnerella vaginalis 6420B]NSX31511.1 50S ribosomal protein L4 [Gardnerella vaginalis]RFT32086.1 50S ribosomal protein L4 [Bifidobacteriaceae bacterium VN003]RFT33110.1 50S ribosomal protein L4 [Bifidobacteriaceae bacterium NR019]RFT35172.1 50S ribosomal protein L4 [Bifidobacteriaceae bacterium NR017]RFT37128.1 50S ribosomal protein L4 [Bifid
MANVTLNVTDTKGNASGTVEAPAEIFGISNEDVLAHGPLVHQVVIAQLAAARQGTHAVKNRANVSGGGKKPWKQKGTGRARQGSIRAPQWVHGGVVHGPVPRKYDQRTPKKMKAAALRYVLSDRANAGRIAVVDFGIKDVPSTKTAVAALTPVTNNQFTTVVLSRENINEWMSVRNIPTVHVIFADQLNTYDVVTAQYVVFSKEGFEAFVAAKTEPVVKEA